MTKTQPVSIVLVHGGFVDGSGWERVYALLRADGYDVAVVQNATLSLDNDVEVTRLAIAAQTKPVILVGHSYGGAVITEAGTDPKVSALVYIAAFAPDRGESVETLIANPPPDAPVAPIVPATGGYFFVDKTKFHAAFAADVPADKAAFMADSQVPWGLAALTGMITTPAWRTKPSWYLVTTDDHMLPPPTQRIMAKRCSAVIEEHPGSHAIYVSRPDLVAGLIAAAAQRQAVAA